MLINFVIIISLVQLELINYIAKFSFIVILAAYYAGQYSAKFTKEEK